MEVKYFIKVTSIKVCIASLLLAFQPIVYAIDATNKLFLGALDESLRTANNSLTNSLGEPNRWLEEVEGRWSLSDSEKNKQQFTLRIKPKSASQHTAESNVRSLMIKQRRLEEQISLINEVRLRYLLVTKYVFYQDQLSIGISRKEHFAQQVKLFHALVQSEKFQPEKLLKIELSLRNQEINNKVTSQKIVVIKEKLLTLSGRSLQDEFIIKRANLLPITEVSSVLDLISSTKMNNDLLTEFSIIVHQIANQELQREKSLNGFGLNFMDLQYEEENGRLSDQSFKFSVGVRIPIGENYALTKKKLEVLEAENDLIEQRYKARKLNESIQMNINFLETEYREVISAIKKIEDNLRNKVIKRNMSLILGLKQEKFDLIERSSKLKHEIYEQYIQYLYITGELSKRPLKNWLHTDLPIL